jgi:DNA-binding transcriptional LysR family regulator
MQARELPSPAGPMPRWDDVRLFLALFRERNLARAGKRLGVDASTTSRRLAGLERELGTRLFDRTREGLRATHAAERLFSPAERMEAAALVFAGDASGFERAVEGRVRISAPPGVADVFLADAIAALHARHPAIVLEIDSRIAVVDLGRREADLALRTVRPRGQDLVQKKLLTTKATLLGSPAYVRSLGTLRSFRDARYVSFGEVLAVLPHGAWIKKHIPDPPVVLVSESYPCQLRAAAAGAGLVFAPPTYGAAYELVEAKLAPALRAALAELPEDDLWLVGHMATREVPRIAAVWSFVEEVFGGVTTAAGVRTRSAVISGRR